jgi:hypothetical protein
MKATFLIRPELLLITINRNMILTKLDFDPKFGSKSAKRLMINQKLLLMLILRFEWSKIRQNGLFSNFGVVWQCNAPKNVPETLTLSSFS